MAPVCKVGLSVILAGFSTIAQAQTNERPSHTQTPQASNSPYGPQWAKPSGTTGGQIYNDPRQRDPNSSYKTQRSKPCPAPTLYDPASGNCR